MTTLLTCLVRPGLLQIGLWALVLPKAARSAEAEACNGVEQCLEQQGPGHALLATRAVRTTLSEEDTQLLEHGSPAEHPGQDSLARIIWSEEQSGQVVDSRLTKKAEKLPSVMMDLNGAAAVGDDPDPLTDRQQRTPLVGNDLYRENQPGSAANGTFDIDLPEEPAEEKHILAGFIVVPIASVFFVAFTIVTVFEKFGLGAAIPESAIMIVIGMILGFFLKFYAEIEIFDDAENFSKLNAAILNLVLLPIIIFASGWTIRRQDFYSQFPYILLFAVVGVALSTVVIAFLIRITGSMNWHSMHAWRTAFAYASLISATDPIATLSTYAKLKVDPLLNILVFGESVINDAVAIVLFHVFNDDNFMVDSRGETLTGFGLLLYTIWGVIKGFCCSVGLGTALGIIYTLIAHWADMRKNKKGQILVIFSSCYLTFAFAEMCGLSGIIAVMFCAILMGIYMRPHLSQEGSLLATFFVKQLAALADAAVSLLIGVSVAQLNTRGLYFGMWVMLFCLVGRFVSVFPLGYVVNIAKSVVGKTWDVPEEGWNLLTPQHMFMMWHAGLRGAIALALSLELGQWVDIIDGAGTRRALQTATFLLICTFLLLFGGSTSFFLDYFGIPTGKDHPPNILSKTEDMGTLRGFLKWVDHRMLSPLLIGNVEDNAGEDDEEDVEDLLKEHHLHRW